MQHAVASAAAAAGVAVVAVQWEIGQKDVNISV